MQPQCAKVKNPCKFCLQAVSNKNGLQCMGACKKWAHYKCLNYTAGKISDIKAGIIKVTCPCPDCDTSQQKEFTSAPYSCSNIECPANKVPKCDSFDCPVNRKNVVCFPPSPDYKELCSPSQSCQKSPPSPRKRDCPIKTPPYCPPNRPTSPPSPPSCLGSPPSCPPSPPRCQPNPPRCQPNPPRCQQNPARCPPSPPRSPPSPPSCHPNPPRCPPTPPPPTHCHPSPPRCPPSPPRCPSTPPRCPQTPPPPPRCHPNPPRCPPNPPRCPPNPPRCPPSPPRCSAKPYCRTSYSPHCTSKPRTCPASPSTPKPPQCPPPPRCPPTSQKPPCPPIKTFCPPAGPPKPSRLMQSYSATRELNYSPQQQLHDFESPMAKSPSCSVISYDVPEYQSNRPSFISTTATQISQDSEASMISALQKMCTAVNDLTSQVKNVMKRV